MSVQPSTDRDLARTAGRHWASGSRFLLIGVVLAALGVALIVLGGGLADFAGLALLILSSPPLMVGIGLVLSAILSHWTAKHRPFA